jgi:hypothetical protein
MTREALIIVALKDAYAGIQITELRKHGKIRATSQCHRGYDLQCIRKHHKRTQTAQKSTSSAEV